MKKELLRKTGTQFVYKVKTETNIQKSKIELIKKKEVEIPIVNDCRLGYDENVGYCYEIEDNTDKHLAYFYCDYIE